MKYFFDTEFIEGTQQRPLILKSRLGHLMFGYQKPTIDLISIGIVAEDNREYYAISKEFNLKEAWNRCDEKHIMPSGDMRNTYPNGYIQKTYWLRDNVLKPINAELLKLEADFLEKQRRIIGYAPVLNAEFSYSNFKRLLKKYGKSNTEIATEIKKFCQDEVAVFKVDGKLVGAVDPYRGNPEFYAYYAGYDWVAFCWLFGKMMDLPNGFPMYCRDLKQIIDAFCYNDKAWEGTCNGFEKRLELLKSFDGYPKQDNAHNALDDAHWNKNLYKFINDLDGNS
jgi:hypothetical protein